MSGLNNLSAALQGNLWWTSKAPLSCSVFNNHQVGKVSDTCSKLSCARFSPNPNYYACRQLFPDTTELFDPSPCPSLASVKENIAEVINPDMVTHRKCTLMLLSNLAEAEWLSVDCDEKLLAHVLCVEKSTCTAHTVSKEDVFRAKLTMCDNQSLKLNKSCYAFHFTENRSLTFLPKGAGNSFVNELGIFALKDIFFSVKAQVPNLILLNSTKNIVSGISGVLTCMKILRKVTCKWSHLNRNQTEHNKGFVVTMKRLTNVRQRSNHFQCHNSSVVVLTSSLCDGKLDCPDGNDELNCNCSGSSVSPKCKYVVDKMSNKSKCGFLFFTTLNGSCYHFTTMTRSNIHSQSKQIRCAEIYSTDPVWLDDIFVDCPGYHGEESILMNLLFHSNHSQCPRSGQLPCKQGHTKCFNVTSICIFILNTFGHLTPCRNGGHLDDCASFQCNTHFKCSNSYCILGTSVCNSRWDCPDGGDQASFLCSSILRCSNLFRCKNTQNMCIHIALSDVLV